MHVRSSRRCRSLYSAFRRISSAHRFFLNTVPGQGLRSYLAAEGVVLSTCASEVRDSRFSAFWGAASRLPDLCWRPKSLHNARFEPLVQYFRAPCSHHACAKNSRVRVAGRSGWRLAIRRRVASARFGATQDCRSRNGRRCAGASRGSLWTGERSVIQLR